MITNFDNFNNNFYTKESDGTANNIWFAFDNFNPTENNITHNYNTNRQMIYNIIP